jgi:transcriptional regulator with XRE-family HTH domain
LNNLKNIRKRKDMTLKDVSEKTGLSMGYLCHLERGTRKNPTLHTMGIISDCLEVSIWEIWDMPFFIA